MNKLQLLLFVGTFFSVCCCIPAFSQAEEFLIDRNALTYDRATMAAEMREKIKGAATLAGNPAVKKPDRMLATFEYDFETPANDWYRIDVPKAHRFEYEIDNQDYGIGSDTAGSFYLAKGKHTLVLKKRSYFNAWNPVEKIIIREAGQQPAERIRISGVHFVNEAVIRKSESYTLKVQTGFKQETELVATITNKETHAAAGEIKTVIPAGDNVMAELNIPATQTGIYEIAFSIGGAKAENTGISDFRMLVMDTSPVKARVGTELDKKLLLEIDCAQKEPDYSGGGGTRVIRKQFGSYRETGDVSWVTHMNENEPSWFAYTIDVPETDKQYVAEIDYPDDANRTYAIAVRNAGNTTYPVAGGVETGHDYRLSNTLKTHTLLFWAREKASRLVIANASDKHRGAAAKIRIYQLADEPLPLAVNPQIEGRTFANWFEEGTCFVGLFGGNMPNTAAKPLGDFMKSADRWAGTMAYMGCNTLYPTLLVYQFGLYPSDYNLFATRATNDLAEIILLAAEKYEMNVLFDFHPEARQLKWAMENQKNLLRSRSGEISSFSPMLGPLHPVNQTWLCSVIKEFASRYKHSKAFKGISLRHMSWYNHALCNFHSLDWGYDDYTVGLFESETGIKIPGIKPDDDGRFEKRFFFLTNPKNKQAWIDWRCKKIGELYERISTILRTERADLVLRSSVFSKDAGVDPELLSQIPNVETFDDCSYGRRGRGETNRHDMLEKLLAPNSNASDLISSAAYFEATGKVIPPVLLGFPESTKTTWMSAVVNASGRLMLERFALSVARFDSLSLQDGGNAWSIGQPELREFMKEYRVIPKMKFKTVHSLDPVSVRQNGAYFYAVNMMPFALETNITVNNGAQTTSLTTGQAEDVSTLKLKAYELRAFRTTGDIQSVTTSVPEKELQTMREQLRLLGESIALVAPAHKQAIAKLHASCAACLSSGKYWEFATRLRLEEKELDTAGVALADFYQDGLPITPAAALSAKSLAAISKTKTTLASSQGVISDWCNEEILSSEQSEPLTLTLPVSATGYYHLRIGIVTGGDYGNVSAEYNTEHLGSTTQIDTTPTAGEFQFTKPLALKDGEVTITLTPKAGKRVGISYLQLTPSYTLIPPLRWKVSENIGKIRIEEKHEIETKRDYTGWKALDGFDPFVDISCGVPIQGGTVRYAVTFIHSPDTRKVRLSFGVDYWAKMWLNGIPVKPTGERKVKSGAPNRGEETLDITLQEGWNELLLKIASGSGRNGFWMEITNKNDLRFSADPTADQAPHAVVIPENGRTIVTNDFETEQRGHAKQWNGSGSKSYTGNGAAQLGMYFHSAKVDGGKTYLLQAYLRSEKDGDGGRIQINWSSPEVKLLKYDLSSPKLTTDYNRYQLPCKAPDTATGAFIIIGTENGNEWIDDLWFGEVSPQ